MSVEERELTFVVGETTGSVSAILLRPAGARAIYVLAHGAGAGMRHKFMEGIARQLADRDIATFRYQFPYMEAGKNRPDVPNKLVATVRRAVETAAQEAPDLKIIAGGKSLGGRMTSTAAAKDPLQSVSGIAFLGFPLHAPNRPSDDRAAHLHDVTVPMLFLQGTRDALASLELMKPLCKRLGAQATLHIVEGGDHSFKVLKRTGRTDEQAMQELADEIDRWTSTL